MGKEIHVHGGVSLQGRVRIQGSKNAALPILAAALLTKEENVLCNCPRITDVFRMLDLLRSIGCLVRWEEQGVCVDAGHVSLSRLPADAVMGMRSSLCLLGALLGRCGEAAMEHPGGCVIGERPIDLHLSALRRMGVDFWEEEGLLHARAARGLSGAELRLPIPSVGATENIILAAVCAQGDTRLQGCAREPEVEALCRYLVCCGARIDGIGTGELVIRGGKRLFGTSFRIPADRIVAGTYLFGTLAAGGCAMLEEAPCSQMEAVISLARDLGAVRQAAKEGLWVQAPRRLRHVPLVRTKEYPGFPTDLQSIAMTVLSGAPGTSRIEENIFEDRFRVVEPLSRMGADLRQLSARQVIVQGPRRLKGQRVEAVELRGGAALVVAGLMARGETVITGCPYIERGYENICKDLRELGARIYCV